jgi:hypothetical protein
VERRACTWRAEVRSYGLVVSADRAGFTTAATPADQARRDRGHEHVAFYGRATTPLGVASGTPLVNGNGQSGKSLATKDWGSGVTGIVRAGDLFQLGSGGSAHLYMVAQDANSSIGSTATLEIWPRLRVSPANDDPLTFNNPVGQWRLKEPFDYTIDIAMIFGISVSLVEAF